MNHAKRMLALLLTLALVFTLALPSFASEEASEEPSKPQSIVNWNEFRITKQPESPTITHGESFTLNVEVNAPEGVEVEYQWYSVANSDVKKIEGAITPTLHLNPNDNHYPENKTSGGHSTIYRCKLIGYEKDEDGNVVSSSGRFTSADVRIERTSSGKLYDLLIQPFVSAFWATFGMLSMTIGLLLPVSPIIFLGFLILGFAHGFKGLFS